MDRIQSELMKSGSSLNPHAASYVPLSKRVPDHKAGSVQGTSGNLIASNVNVIFESTAQFGQGKDQEGPSIHPNFHEAENVHHGHWTDGSTSQCSTHLADKQIANEEFEMDLEYLRMTFPGLSDESLIDVYLENRGDLEATIDMLTQLEFNPDEFPEHLPETLDIGDVAVPAFIPISGAVKPKNVKGEATASSSGGSDPAI